MVRNDNLFHQPFSYPVNQPMLQLLFLVVAELYSVLFFSYGFTYIFFGAVQFSYVIFYSNFRYAKAVFLCVLLSLYFEVCVLSNILFCVGRFNSNL